MADSARLEFQQGVKISLKTPGRDRAGLEDFCGMCHGAGGCAAMTPTKSNIDTSPTWMDMDAATGYKRKPGSAGAHPTMRRAGSADDYTFMVKNAAGSLGPGYLCCNVKQHVEVMSYPIETD